MRCLSHARGINKVPKTKNSLTGESRYPEAVGSGYNHSAASFIEPNALDPAWSSPRNGGIRGEVTMPLDTL